MKDFLSYQLQVIPFSEWHFINSLKHNRAACELSRNLKKFYTKPASLIGKVEQMCDLVEDYNVFLSDVSARKFQKKHCNHALILCLLQRHFTEKCNEECDWHEWERASARVLTLFRELRGRIELDRQLYGTYVYFRDHAREGEVRSSLRIRI